ncbi:hypothetical protein VNO77_16293 [Canavalia gladiata]|uniref:Uncharacterized protein n=1 Tax=Canavalia gladiata TaxID=3824 RepID=A0AAN9M3U8_CANGL
MIHFNPIYIYINKEIDSKHTGFAAMILKSPTFIFRSLGLSRPKNKISWIMAYRNSQVILTEQKVKVFELAVTDDK